MSEQATVPKDKSGIWEWIKALVIALGLAFVIRYFLFAPILVEGVSMMPTLYDQERMIVNKLSYVVGKPDRFDIIVFKVSEDKNYIKRVIGLPGDHVEYKDDMLYINGKAVEEPYLDDFKKQVGNGVNLTEDFTLEQVTNESVIPEGKLFVLGDNRQYSKDSRIIGLIDIDDVMGQTNLVYWPLSEFKLVK